MAYLSCFISVGVGTLGSMPALGSLAGLPSLSSGSGDPTRIGDAAITLGSQFRMLSNFNWSSCRAKSVHWVRWLGYHR